VITNTLIAAFNSTLASDQPTPQLPPNYAGILGTYSSEGITFVTIFNTGGYLSGELYDYGEVSYTWEPTLDYTFNGVSFVAFRFHLLGQNGCEFREILADDGVLYFSLSSPYSVNIPDLHTMQVPLTQSAPSSATLNQPGGWLCLVGALFNLFFIVS